MKKLKSPKETNSEDEREGLLNEYRLLKTEIHNSQGRRLQIVSLTVGVFGVIISASAGTVLGSQSVTSNARLLIAIGSSIALYSILISSLIMVISVQQAIQRIGEYIRLFIEPKVAGLNWETHWFEYKLRFKHPGGIRGLSSIYFFLSFLPVLLPGYALSQNIQNWYFVLILVPLLVLSLYLTYDLSASFSSSWKWARWEHNDKINKEAG